LAVNDDGLLAEQRAYYRARAPEYDEWWQRRGRYDRGPDLAEEWDRQVAQVAAALETFDAEPQRTYDVVFFSFWLSHVPRSRFSVFWSLVRCCLAPGGRVFLIDNRNERHPVGEIEDPYVVPCGPDVELRRVHDGSTYQVVEVFYEPEQLQSLLGHKGWTARLDATRWFIFGEARWAEGGAQAGPGVSHIS
jgi:hypothetical protein